MKLCRTLAQRCVLRRFFSDKLKSGIRGIQCASNIPAAVVSPEGFIGCISEALQTHSGYSEKELRNRSVYDLIQGEQAQQWCRRAHRDIIENKYDMLRREFYFLKKDGNTMPLDTILIAVRSARGKLLYIRYILQDLTQSKRNEQKLSELVLRFSLIMKSGNMFPWHYNLENGKISIPEEYQKHADFRQTNYKLEDFAEKVHSGDWPALSEDIRKLREGTLERFNREIKVNVYGRGYIWCSLTAVVHEYYPDRRPKSLLGFLIIIQAHKDAELRLARALEKAEESDHLKTRLLANFSHEIRTPLNIITGFASLSAENGNDPQTKEYLAILRENSDRFLSMIDKAIILSQIESENRDIPEGNADWDMMTDILHARYSRNLNGHIRFLIRTDPAAPRRIPLDPDLLGHVLNNLLENAFNNTEKGTVSLYYSVRGKSGYFRVADTGAGIPSEKLGIIFERFEKLDPSRPGLGLGLTICKAIAEKAGGTITVSSVQGQGSEFTFTFPLPY